LQGGKSAAEGQEPLLLHSTKIEKRRNHALQGGLLFGSFVLAAQNKGTRLRGRNPRLKNQPGDSQLFKEGFIKITNPVCIPTEDHGNKKGGTLTGSSLIGREIVGRSLKTG